MNPGAITRAMDPQQQVARVLTDMRDADYESRTARLESAPNPADRRALACSRLRELESLAVDCARRGLTLDQFIAMIQGELLDLHPYRKQIGDRLAYDGSTLLDDLLCTGRRIDAMYREALSEHRPRTAREQREDEQRAAHYALLAERRSTMPPVETSQYRSKFTAAETALTKKAGYEMRCRGHVPRGYFGRTGKGALANSCSGCGRWIQITADGQMSGSAFEESCRG